MDFLRVERKLPTFSIIQNVSSLLKRTCFYSYHHTRTCLSTKEKRETSLQALIAVRERTVEIAKLQALIVVVLSLTVE